MSTGETEADGRKSWPQTYVTEVTDDGEVLVDVPFPFVVMSRVTSDGQRVWHPAMHQGTLQTVCEARYKRNLRSNGRPRPAEWTIWGENSYSMCSICKNGHPKQDGGRKDLVRKLHNDPDSVLDKLQAELDKLHADTNTEDGD